MRDLLVAFIVFGSLPFILKRPFWGIVLMAGLGYMNPHRLCYGFMLTMPVVMIVALVTLIGMLVSKEAKRMVWSREIVVLVIFIVWMGITTTQAFNSNEAGLQYEKVIKIQILTFMTLLLLTSREKVNLLVWAIVFSLGFYGVKGGIFTIAKGGVHRVQGPEGTFIAGNNELALAMVMTIPLMYYLYLHEKHKWLKPGLMVGMILTAISAFGTQSRGALVALILTGIMFWLKSRNKIRTAAMVAFAGLAGMSIMPEEWYARMHTIETYDQDQSAQGRINSWWTAVHIATDRIFGGGFETWIPSVFQRYAPDPTNVRDVHSIYFEVLGEHGWPGLIIFLSLLALTWMTCNSTMRYAKNQPELLWAKDLAAMIQVSMVAYMSAGAFLGLAYFDYLYHLIAIVVVVHYMVVVEPSRSVGSNAAAQAVAKPDVRMGAVP
ncbi:MAG: putative O-glycosylation ligase, exosortase A system-associated [Burkholderiaceae bacterium]|nr:putative O-glycosylation ligase, exosortase A system-associated [Burkholderiaceae bacterium]